MPETERAGPGPARGLPGVFAIIAAVSFVATQASACLVCIALPERTIADRVIEAEAVVLAREDPDRRFSFVPIATLKGAADGLPIPFLVDSATRLSLAADADAAILFARDDEGWTRVADADAEVGGMIRAILAAAPEWGAATDHAARFAYFADRHDHMSPTIRDLALAEISRSPYSLIRGMIPRLTRAEIVRVLRDPKWGEWAPVHILFLGLSSDPVDHAFVRRAFDAAAAHGGPHLAAWAVALVEIDGLPAVERLRARFFNTPQGDPEALRAVVAAFAMLAREGDARLRPGIDAAFRNLASGPPALAGEVARHLIWAQDFSQAAVFDELVASGAIDDPAAEFVISVYLDAAREAPAPSIEGNPQ